MGLNSVLGNSSNFPSSFECNKNVNEDPKKTQILLSQERLTLLIKDSLSKTAELYPTEIFGIESLVREELKKDFPNKEEVQKSYDEEILPCLKSVKSFISKSDHHFAVQAAASKGKALQAAMKALKNTTQNNPVLENNVESIQNVFLLPKDGAVFKSATTESAKEEESVVNALFDLMSKQAVVGSFDVQNSSMQRYGININSNDIARGFSWNDMLSPLLRFAIQARLSPLSFGALPQPRFDLKVADRAKTNFEYLQVLEWVIKIPGKENEKVSLQELQKRYVNETLPPESLISSVNSPEMSLNEHILKESSLFHALNYFPSLSEEASSDLCLTPDFADSNQKNCYEVCEQYLCQYVDEFGQVQQVNFKTYHANFLQNKTMLYSQFFSLIPFAPPLSQQQLDIALSVHLKEESIPKIYLSPDLSDPLHREVYEHCERFLWQFVDEFGVLQLMDFKNFYANTLEFKSMWNIEPKLPSHLSSRNPSDLPTYPTNEQLQLISLIPWKVCSQQPLGVKTCFNSAGLIERFESLKVSQLQAKPFIKDMILLSQLDAEGNEMVLKRLTDEAQFNAILTAELQLLDLHKNNVGVEPESNVEYEQFKEVQFFLPASKKKQTFKNLISEYLSGRIFPHTLIQFNVDKKMICKPLRDLPELQKALDVKWKLVLFDMDRSLSEGNEILRQTYSNKIGHLIPLRSALLETSAKDHPLSEAVVHQLMNSQERDHRVKHWAAKKDAPIYKHLSKADKSKVKQILAPVIEKYRLSELRKNRRIATIKNIAKNFAKEVSNIEQSEFLEIWQIVEDHLSMVTVRAGDTWDTLSDRHQQTVKALQQLNPQGLKQGEKIKIAYDLTSSDPKAISKRQKLAIQFFPRMTIHQQKALLERQENRRSYLLNYQNLNHSTLQGEELFSQIKEFLQQSTTPISSSKRKKFLSELENKKSQLLNQPQELGEFKKTVCFKCQPSFFNLAKSMYPLLADAYELNQAVFNTKEVGENIGLSMQSLEETIKEAKDKFGANSPEVELACSLEIKITSITNVPFLEHFR